MGQHEVKLGELITGQECRDAILIAVAPIVAGEDLQPGQHVRVEDGNAFASNESAVGVVDPFLREWVRSGQQFWLCLYPRTITSLRHEWSHPAFGGGEEEHWIAVAKVARELAIGGEELMKMADGYAGAGYGAWWPETSEQLDRLSREINWEKDFWPHWRAIREDKSHFEHGNPFDCNC